MRIDNFEKPTKTNALCGNWRTWPHPIIWYQGTTDAVGAQFFLKNIHPDMRDAATELFGRPESLQWRPNVFGELMSILISPSRDVEAAVNWVLGGGREPDITLHIRMLMNRSIRVAQAALYCLKRETNNLQLGSRPKVVVVSDTPYFVKRIVLNISGFSESERLGSSTQMGYFRGLLSCISCKTCGYFWGTQTCWDYVRSVNSCTSCSKQYREKFDIFKFFFLKQLPE